MPHINFKAELETAIIWLERLIEAQDKKEASYQEYFEQNPTVFTVMGYDNFYSFTKESGNELPRDKHTDLKPEPDFIVERDNGLFEIFEIKTPFSKKLMVDSNKYRERFTAEVSNYISQTITYEKYFTRNPDNRRMVKELCGLDIQEDLDIKIIIGLNDQVDKVKIHQKAREYGYKVDIVTYDDILSRLINEYEQVFSINEYIAGFSFHFVVRFREGQLKRIKYFFDIGQNQDKDRISVYIEEKNIIFFEVIDSIGKKYQVEIDTKEVEILNTWVYLVCEFGKFEDGFALSIEVNGEEKDKRVKNSSINLAVSLKRVMLGCDLNKKNFGYFDIAEQLLFFQPLAFRDKHQMQEYISQKYSEDSAIKSYVEFDGRQFIHRNEVGDLIQENEEHKPIFRTVEV